MLLENRENLQPAQVEAQQEQQPVQPAPLQEPSQPPAQKAQKKQRKAKAAEVAGSAFDAASSAGASAATVSSAVVASSVSSKNSAAQKKPRAARAFALPKKILQFDIDILELVKSGENDAGKILSRTGVDPSQFDARLEFLCQKGLLCRDHSDSAVLRLGINGYEQLAKRRAAQEKKENAAAARLAAKPATAASKVANDPAASAATSMASDALGATASVDSSSRAIDKIIENNFDSAAGAKETALGAEKTKSIAFERDAALQGAPAAAQPARRPGDIDLFDLLKKGSPRPGDPALSSPHNGFLSRHPQQQQVLAQMQQARRRVPFEEQVQKLGGKEVVKQLIEETTQSGFCELCRAPFRISTNPSENNPKYGYCFCGAAYHKDCFESIANDADSSCVRCGKKMRMQLDRASEEAVKAVKKMFD